MTPEHRPIVRAVQAPGRRTWRPFPCGAFGIDWTRRRQRGPRRGWRVARSPGLSLAISDEAIEVRGFGPLGKVLAGFTGLRLTLAPVEMVMRTTSFGGKPGPVARPLAEAARVALPQLHPERRDAIHHGATP